MKKSLIIKLLIMILILSMIIIIVLIKLNKKEEFNEMMKEENPELTVVSDIKKEDGEITFSIINECVEQYYSAIEQQDLDKVYNLLDSQYKKGMEKSDILNKVEVLENGLENFRTLRIYSKELEIDKCKYYVFGEVLGKDYATMKNTYIIINVDHANNSFSVTPTNVEEIDLIKYETIIDYLSKEKVNFEEIHKNKNNALPDVTMQTYDIMDFYLKDYITMAIYYPKTGYNLLDEEYKNTKFGNFNKYREYMELNALTLENPVIKSYKFDEKEGYVQYTIIDNNDNTYVFKIYGAMDYKVVVDMYTVDLETVSQTYNESNEQEKVAINIQKIVSALNSKDYEYIYSKLSEGFKQQKYPTLENLKNEFEGKIFGTFDVKFDKFSIEGTTYIYDIELKGKTASSNSAKIQIIMQLLEGQDFVMSFNIKEVL